jgi:L-ascorbate metabolism protein UlaG (beta-lactamase superfamily)
MMDQLLALFLGIGLIFLFADKAVAQHESDVLPTSAGDVIMTFIGHGSLMFTFNGLVIHVDPFSRVADYAQLPKADLILITHEHADHLDLDALDYIRQPTTTVVLTKTCAGQVQNGIVMKNGETQTVKDIKIEAVPAYNVIHKRPDGKPFHPKGVGNGYVLTFGDKRIYVAGDTENIPEMEALGDIDCAFLPMNLPYTMTPEMATSAAKTIAPGILYPYHYGETDSAELVALLKDQKDIEVRIRNLQ